MSEMMVRIDPPEGTIMCEDRLDAQMSTKAGLKFACHYTIRLRDGSDREVPGTVLRYEPNGIQVWVARRGLTGDEVNVIGQLGQRLFAIRKQRDYVPDALVNLEDFIKGVNGLRGVEGIDEDLRLGGEQMLTAIGMFAPILRKADHDLAPKEAEIVVAFSRLGVTLVRSNTWFDFDRAISSPT